MHPTQPGPFPSSPPPSGPFSSSPQGSSPAPRSFGAPAPVAKKQGSNAALWWILGGVGCLGLLVVGIGLAGLGAAIALRQTPEPTYEPYNDPYANPYGGQPTDPWAQPTDPFAQPTDPFAQPTDPFAQPPSDLFGQVPPTPAPTVAYVPVGDSPQEGPDDALVTIVEFSDFQCPFCSRVSATMDRVRTTYGNDVRIVYKHNPLPFHVDAMPAAELSVAAYRSGGDAAFFRAHDLFFENQQSLSRTDLERYGRTLGLSRSDITLALDSHAHQATIRSDMDLAATIGARGTPTFFINGEELAGAQPYESFASVIERKRSEAQALLAAGVPRTEVYDRIMASALIR